jgi:hypothetical protein
MTLSDVVTLRHYIDEQTDVIYGDAFLSDVIAGAPDLFSAAASVWRMKAARYAQLVDTTEAGASRKMSSLSDNALKMAKEFDKQSTDANANAGGFTVTRAIERA